MITLTVNGTTQNIDADADTPLLWVLRDHLSLTGTKYGCGMALCGACTVHVDGAAVRSCVLPLKAVEGKRVTTIEGLSKDRSHAVQRAWMESTCRNAATASRDRSCPRRHCSHPIQRRAMPTSMPRCPEISAGAAPTSVSARPSIGQPSCCARRSQMSSTRERSPARGRLRASSFPATNGLGKRRSRARLGACPPAQGVHVPVEKPAVAS